MNQSDLSKLIEIGILAPSADNLQPWTFKISGDQIDLFLDHNYTKNFCDEGFLAPYSSAGAVIENIRVAAQENGYNLSISYLPIPKKSDFVASLRFLKIDAQNHPHFPALRRRITNRKFYSQEKMDASIYSKFDQLIGTGGNFKLIWIKKSDPKYKYEKLCRILGKADQLRFQNKRLHREFFETLRFTQEEREQTQDGLDFRTLEAGPGSTILFKLISSWKRLNFLNQFGMSFMFNIYTQLQLKTSQACGLIVSKKNSPLEYILGGEVMEKLWHEATLQNLSLQPMEALPIFLIQLKQTGCLEFEPRQKRTLEKLRNEFYSLFSISDANGLIFLFRIGYATQPRFHSMRRDVESFLMK